MYMFGITRIPLRLQRPHHPRLHRARTDRVHPNPQTRHIGRRDLGQAQHPMLGRAVSSHARGAEQTGDRSRVDDGPGALPQHHRQHMPHPQEHALQVDGDDLIEDVFVIVLRWHHLALDARIVEETINAAIAPKRRLDVVPDSGRFRYISLNERRGPALLRNDLDRRLAQAWIGIHHHHLRAAQRETQCARPADAATTASDQRHLACEIHFVFSHMFMPVPGADRPAFFHADGSRRLNHLASMQRRDLLDAIAKLRQHQRLCAPQPPASPSARSRVCG